MIAINRRKMPIIEFLLSHGADTSIKDDLENSAFDYASE
jgi:hypothetical protein